jgi:hypothetical protein
LESVSAKNKLFFSPAPTVPAIHTRMGPTHLSRTRQATCRTTTPRAEVHCWYRAMEMEKRVEAAGRGWTTTRCGTLRPAVVPCAWSNVAPVRRRCDDH